MMMRKLFSLVVLLAGVAEVPSSSRADYPLISHRYLADPDGIEYNGRLYLYCSNDDENAVEGNYIMHSIVCISTDDMKNWTDHGVVFQVPQNASWATFSWAPSVAYRNGQFYMYFGNSAGAIGVASSVSPIGPFVDAKGSALINSGTPGASGTAQWYFDPCVFIDGSQPYLFFGGDGETNGRVVPLNSDMISLAGAAIGMGTVPAFMEASHLHRHNGIYYFTYETNFSGGGLWIRYGMSSSPTSGFTWMGNVLLAPFNDNNNHQSFLTFQGGEYVAYHNRWVAQQNGLTTTAFKRNVCLDSVVYNADGTIQQVVCTTNGVMQLKPLNPYNRVEAETMAQQNGIHTEACSEGGLDVTAIDNGDWTLIRGVDFGTGASGFNARIASASGGGAIELRLDSLTGPLVGTCPVPATAGSQTWANTSCPVDVATAQGLHDLYFIYIGGETNLFNINYWQFQAADPQPLQPVAPTDLTATAVSSHQINLSWTASATATNYQVKRATVSGGPYTTVATALTMPSYNDVGLSNNTTYFYVVSALNLGGASDNSVQASATVPIPSTLAATGDAYVRGAPSADLNFGTEAILRVKLDSADAFLTRESFVRFDVSGLANAKSIEVQLVPVAVSSDASSTSLTFEFVSNDTWTETGVTWNNKPAGSGIVLGSMTGFTVGQKVIVDVTQLAKAEAIGDGTFSLRIYSTVSGAGRLVDFGSREQTTPDYRPVLLWTGGTPPPPLSAPAALTATPVNSGQIDLSWTAGTGATSYTILRAAKTGGPYTLLATGVTSTTYSNTGLTSNTTYYYVVQSANAVSSSGNSDEVNATTQAVVGGVIVTQNVSIGATSWPGTPLISTVANPSAQLIVGEGFGGSSRNTQTFTIVGSNNYTLQRINLYVGGGTGTSSTSPVTLNLFDLGTQSAPNPSSYSPGVNLFGGGNGLPITYVPQTNGVLQLDFLGADQVQLTAGHLYAFEIAGVSGTQPINWLRTISDTYTGGAAYRDRSWINGTNARDFGLAIYAVIGAATPPTITSALTASGAYNTAFTYTIAASNSPTSFNASGLPAGLTFNSATGMISGMPTVVGLFNITLGATNIYGSGSATLTLTIAGQSYASWAVARGLTITNNAPTADPDGDGVPNQLEHLLGLNPLAPDASGLPAGTSQGGQFVFRFVHDKTAGAAYTIEKSTDLLAWSALAASVESSTATTETVIASLPLTATKQFVRLTSGGVSTIPFGYLNTILPAGATIAFGLPLDDASAVPIGLRAAKIESFTDTTITNAAGGWTGNLINPAAPWALRLTSGAAVGKLFNLSANTATTLTFSGATLTSLGVAVGDTFELVSLDTLGTLFGATTLQGGTSAATADVVQVRSGAAWLAFYYDTALGFWRRTSGAATNADNTIIRPGSGLMITRRGTALTLTFTGRVLGTTFRVPVANASTTGITAGYPMDTTLGSLALQNLLSGWRAGTTTSAADSVGVYNGTNWIPYVFNGANWQTTAGANSDSVSVSASSVLLISRPGTTAGTTDLMRNKPY